MPGTRKSSAAGPLLNSDGSLSQGRNMERLNTCLSPTMDREVADFKSLVWTTLSQWGLLPLPYWPGWTALKARRTFLVIMACFCLQGSFSIADRGPSEKDGNFLSPRMGWRGTLGRTIFFFLGGDFTKSSSSRLKSRIMILKINSIQQNLSNSLRFKRGCFLLLRLEIILFKREKMWTPILPFHHLAWLPPFQIYVFTQPENVVMIKNQIYNIDHLTGRSWSSNELANKSGDMTAW